MFPVSYTFEDGRFVYSESTTTCPWTGNGGERTCYYNREIKPKLVDCDLGTDSEILDPSLRDGVYTYRSTDRGNMDFTFSFESPVLLSSVTFYYYCSDTRYTVVAYFFLSTGFLGPVALVCERTNTLSQATYTLDTGEMQYQEIRLSVRYNGRQPVVLYSHVPGQ